MLLETEENHWDGMLTLWKGYLATPDKDFSSYIKQKKIRQDLSEWSLMTMAENKYKGLVQTVECNAPTNDILALTAKL